MKTTLPFQDSQLRCTTPSRVSSLYKTSPKVLSSDGTSKDMVCGFNSSENASKTKQDPSESEATRTTGNLLPTSSCGDEYLLTSSNTSMTTRDEPVTVVTPSLPRQREPTFGKISHPSKYSTVDTFRNLFGEELLQSRKMFRKIRHTDDSFANVFGRRSLLDDRENQEVVTTRQSTGVPLTSTLPTEKKGDLLAHGSNLSINKRLPLARRIPTRSAFNPITGQSYEKSKVAEEPQVLVTPSETTVGKVTALDSVSVGDVSSASTLVQDKPSSLSAADPQVGPKNQPRSRWGICNSGLKPHPSTRVNQPPGGQTTKVW